jgi:hypothetical protein
MELAAAAVSTSYCRQEEVTFLIDLLQAFSRMESCLHASNCWLYVWSFTVDIISIVIINLELFRLLLIP